MVEHIILQFPSRVKTFCSIFKKNNFEIYVVGGIVRDMLLQELTLTQNAEDISQLPSPNYNDIDFTTNALPNEMLALFPKAIPTGIQHGTLTILFSGNSYEVTSYRKDDVYRDFRRPSQVHFTPSLEEDLRRRDFTINAFACDPIDGKVIDIFNGMEDLQRKLIRCVGNPQIRMNEDILRVLRCIRFATTLGFEIEKETYSAVCTSAKNIVHISKERICNEVRKILCSSDSIRGIKLLHHSGILQYLLQSVMNKESDNDLAHIFDFPSTKKKLRIGGAHTDKIALHSDEEIVRTCIFFSPHIFFERKSMDRIESAHHAQIVKSILIGLKFPNKIIQPVTSILGRTHYCRIVKNEETSSHKYALKIRMTDFKFSLLLVQLGSTRVEILLHYLRSFSALSQNNNLNTHAYEQDIKSLFEKVHDENFLRRCISMKALNVNGHTLTQELGLSEGKDIGSLLGTLHRHVLRYPEDNKKALLLNLARHRLKNRK